MKPIRRRIWALRGRTPLVWERPRWWLYVYTFVRPSMGENKHWLLPLMNTESLGVVLEAIARTRGAGRGEWVLVVLDRAGWHTSTRLRVPEGVGLVFSPPYSPELQPVERAWSLVDAVVASVDAVVVNGQVGTEEELWKRVEAQCAYLQTQHDLIRSYTLFRWWPGGC
nr:transposase [Thermus thermamylovorans]